MFGKFEKEELKKFFREAKSDLRDGTNDMRNFRGDFLGECIENYSRDIEGSDAFYEVIEAGIKKYYIFN